MVPCSPTCVWTTARLLFAGPHDSDHPNLDDDEDDGDVEDDEEEDDGDDSSLMTMTRSVITECKETSGWAFEWRDLHANQWDRHTYCTEVMVMMARIVIMMMMKIFTNELKDCVSSSKRNVIPMLIENGEAHFQSSVSSQSLAT